jgi:hypothetical protein
VALFSDSRRRLPDPASSHALAPRARPYRAASPSPQIRRPFSCIVHLRVSIRGMPILTAERFARKAARRNARSRQYVSRTILASTSLTKGTGVCSYHSSRYGRRSLCLHQPRGSKGRNRRFLNLGLIFAGGEAVVWSRVRAPSPLNRRLNRATQCRHLRDPGYGEFQNVQTSFIDGLLEL